MKDVRGWIHSIESFGALDGPGIRYIVFLQGCPLRCLFCHNPDSWKMEDGREIGSAEVVKDILRYRHFIENGGVTLSGGEPLMQPDFAAAILQGCHEHGLHTALDTSGGVSLLSCRHAVDEADLLLLDMKAANEDLFQRITSRNMTNTLDLLNYCDTIGKTVWIRHVLVPGLTLSDSHTQELGKLLQHFSCIERVELLPFHKMGEYKWEVLGYPYTLADTQPPADDEVTHTAQILREYGLQVRF